MKTTKATQREYSTKEILGILWKTQRKFLIGTIIFIICSLMLFYSFYKFREYRVNKKRQTPQDSVLQKSENTLRAGWTNVHYIAQR